QLIHQIFLILLLLDLNKTMSLSPVVNTLYGKVQGEVDVTLDIGGLKVYKFAGIPYAKPPVGALRFEPPEEPQPWDGVKQTVIHAPIPMQDKTGVEIMLQYVPAPKATFESSLTMAEDCLYLDIYTPSTDETSKLPVMVWFYGGALQDGMGGLYQGQVLASLYNVVVVVPTYRANIFGFLTLGADTKWPGNMGLRDQVMALKWTRGNIKCFGGDPENVTIFGGSAGGTSVSLHVISPESRGLFHRAISHSGTAYFPFLVREDYSEVLKEVLSILNITDTEPEVVIAKLKKIPATNLLDVQRELKVWKCKYQNRFYAWIDNKFIPNDAREVWKQNGTADLPYIVGCNNTEGAGVVPSVLVETGVTEEHVMAFVANTLLDLHVPEAKLEEVVSMVIDFYGKDLDNDLEKWPKLFAAILADTWFIVPSIMQSNAHADGDKKTYFYYMTRQSRHNHSDVHAPGIKNKPDYCQCDHVDDIIYSFGIPLFPKDQLLQDVEFSEEEKQMSRQWMTYLTNFAKYGDPNKGEAVPENWPLYSTEQKEHLEVGVPFKPGRFEKADVFKFWTETIPFMAKTQNNPGSKRDCFK
uniref:Carboxylic ester hydrolase n=1 Tax=Ciona savignyi TaxID=51511 RepID=H2ZGR2_CIOSA